MRPEHGLSFHGNLNQGFPLHLAFDESGAWCPLEAAFHSPSESLEAGAAKAGSGRRTQRAIG